MNGFKQLIYISITIGGWIVSLVFTIRFACALFSPETLNERVLAYGAGFLWNTIEVGLLFYYKDNKQYTALAYVALFCCVFFALISALSSFGALQIGSERATFKSIQYQQNLKSIALQDSLVKDLRYAAKRQDKIDHISASKRTLVDVIYAQKDREKYLKKLDTLTETKAGINNSFFVKLSYILNKDINLVTIICHIIFSLGLEFGMLFFASVSINQENKAVPGNGNGQRNRSFWKRSLNKQSSQTPVITARNDGNGILNKGVGNEIVAEEPDTNNRDKKFFGFQPIKNVSETKISQAETFQNVSKNNSKIVSGTKSPPNEPLTLTKNVSENELKNHFSETFQGKTDPFILHIWDNWNDISRKKRSYGNVTKLVGTILPGIKKSVSKTHVWRTIKRERGGA
jgi:hypothetical protein